MPVCGATVPIHRGAKPSFASMIATRDGTIIVAFREVVIAISAPMVMIHSPPRGRYRDATWVIDSPGRTPIATTDINR